MAITRNANTIYVAAGTSATNYTTTNNKTQYVYYVIVSGESAAGSLTCWDAQGTPVKKIELYTASGASTYFDFSSLPIQFPNGIRAETDTGVNATLVLKQAGT